MYVSVCGAHHSSKNMYPERTDSYFPVHYYLVVDFFSFPHTLLDVQLFTITWRKGWGAVECRREIQGSEPEIKAQPKRHMSPSTYRRKRIVPRHSCYAPAGCHLRKECGTGHLPGPCVAKKWFQNFATYNRHTSNSEDGSNQNVPATRVWCSFSKQLRAISPTSLFSDSFCKNDSTHGRRSSLGALSSKKGTREFRFIWARRAAQK